MPFRQANDAIPAITSDAGAGQSSYFPICCNLQSSAGVRRQIARLEQGDIGQLEASVLTDVRPARGNESFVACLGTSLHRSRHALENFAHAVKTSRSGGRCALPCRQCVASHKQAWGTIIQVTLKGICRAGYATLKGTNQVNCGLS